MFFSSNRNWEESSEEKPSEGANERMSDSVESDDESESLLNSMTFLDLCFSIALALSTTAGDIFAFLFKIARTFKESGP